jgi:uncharacterized membrane protein YdbT with pleckstrin-like domain
MNEELFFVLKIALFASGLLCILVSAIIVWMFYRFNKIDKKKLRIEEYILKKRGYLK